MNTMITRLLRANAFATTRLNGEKADMFTRTAAAIYETEAALINAGRRFADLRGARATRNATLMADAAAEIARLLEQATALHGDVLAAIREHQLSNSGESL